MLQIPSVSLVRACMALGLLTTTSATSSYLNSSSSSKSSSPGYDCTAGQSCWPTADEWASFNTSLSGNLHRTIPLAARCYYNSPQYNYTACEVVEYNYTVNQFRTDVYGAATQLNWESCLTEIRALDGENPTAVQSDQCYLGRLSSLYVDAQNATEVATAIKFARAHNMRISIKNTGHDYFGRSTSPNSLAIWTHNLNNMTYHANFTAYNCPAANGQNIGEMGGGTQATDAYPFFQNYNMDVSGGNEGSVGLAGGFGQGGGHGVFGPSHGLMVDNAVEFDVVTADGQFRTINQCNDPDLFWAMRGGGGGSFALLINYRFQLHEAVKINVYEIMANFTVPGRRYRYQLRYIGRANNVSGHAYYWPFMFQVYLVLSSDNETALKSLSNEFSSFLTNHSNISVTASKYTTYPLYTGFLELTEAITEDLTPGGLYEILASRLVPESLFEGQSIRALVGAVIDGMKTSQELNPGDTSMTQVIMTTPINVQNGNKTSANPAWRDALWHTIMSGGWFDNLSVENNTQLVEGWLDTIEPLKALTPGGGCYMNEGHYLEPEWQETFWGPNYPELLRVKKQYDSTHFFDCYKCVGWEQSKSDYCYALN